MDKLRNLSLKKTIILYMALSLIGTFFLSAAVIEIAERTQSEIWWKYTDQETYYEIAADGNIRYMKDLPRPDESEMTKLDYTISEICDFLQTFSVLILSVLGSCVAVGLFYRNKLKQPIVELEQASKNIGSNHLDFQITYENKDEMGHLCREFERMRMQLAQNNQELWRTVEEEKTLRAAIAHDIRSPLSILKGYQEMLMEYLPDETIDMEQALQMLDSGMKQIERMDAFVETMRKLSSLDGRVMRTGEITAGQLENDLRPVLEMMRKNSGKCCTLHTEETEEVFYGDRDVIVEVAENLLSNAFRFAKEQVEIGVHLTGLELILVVNDDGTGFGGKPDGETESFYQQNAKDSLKHAGLGMYISRLYCEKHGGKLLAEGSEKNGAKVTAVFRRIV